MKVPTEYRVTDSRLEGRQRPGGHCRLTTCPHKGVARCWIGEERREEKRSPTPRQTQEDPGRPPRKPTEALPQPLGHAETCWCRVCPSCAAHLSRTEHPACLETRYPCLCLGLRLEYCTEVVDLASNPSESEKEEYRRQAGPFFLPVPRPNSKGRPGVAALPYLLRCPRRGLDFTGGT